MMCFSSSITHRVFLLKFIGEVKKKAILIGWLLNFFEKIIL